MKKDNAYYPSPFAANKYVQYLRYLTEYIRFNDWKSVNSSLRFVMNGIPERERRVANSRLGSFVIRQGTTDFQFINYAYEREIRNYIKDNINSFDSFIDVGACIGEYCVWLAGMGKQCYAFEPVPANYSSLKENILLNKVTDGVNAYNYGLGGKEEEVVFEVMETVTGSSHISRDENVEGQKVSIKRMDDILNSKEISDDNRVILKMDVEGMETEVLSGGTEFVKRIKDLRVIYEHSFSGADAIKEMLVSLAKFEFTYLDKYNIMATKLAN